MSNFFFYLFWQTRTSNCVISNAIRGVFPIANHFTSVFLNTCNEVFSNPRSYRPLESHKHICFYLFSAGRGNAHLASDCTTRLHLPGFPVSIFSIARGGNRVDPVIVTRLSCGDLGGPRLCGLSPLVSHWLAFSSDPLPHCAKMTLCGRTGCNRDISGGLLRHRFSSRQRPFFELCVAGYRFMIYITAMKVVKRQSQGRREKEKPLQGK